MERTPADRGHLETERRNAATFDLDALPVGEILMRINDQDATVPGVVRGAIPAIARLVEAVVARMQSPAGGRLIYIGAGTSGRLGVLDASECPPTFHVEPGVVIGIIAGGDAALRKSSEGMEDDPDGARAELTRLGLSANDTVVGIAAGGTTPYVLGGLGIAKELGAGTGLVTCVRVRAEQEEKSPGIRGVPLIPGLERDSRNGVIDHVIEVVTGPEVVTGSTRMKAGTATKLVLNMISTAVMVRLGKTWGNLMVDLRATNAKLRDRAARILVSQTDLSREAALELLERAGNRVKLALVMERLKLDAAEAQAKLDAHRGQLRPLLGAPRA